MQSTQNVENEPDTTDVEAAQKRLNIGVDDFEAIGKTIKGKFGRLPSSFCSIEEKNSCSVRELKIIWFSNLKLNKIS